MALESLRDNMGKAYFAAHYQQDPASGEVLDQESTLIGTLTIGQVREKIAIGSYNGSLPPQAGDRAEKK